MTPQNIARPAVPIRTREGSVPAPVRHRVDGVEKARMLARVMKGMG